MHIQGSKVMSEELSDELSDELIGLIERDNIDKFQERFSRASPKNIEAILNTPDSCKNYLIHAAVAKNDLPLITWLIDNGADTEIYNYWGNTSIELAHKLSFGEAAALLENHKPRNTTEARQALFNEERLKSFQKEQQENTETGKKPTESTINVTNPAHTPQVSHPSAKVKSQPKKEMGVKTSNALKILLISNAFTALIAVGSLYFSYQAMNEAREVHYYAFEIESTVDDIEGTVDDIERWGVTCD
jgi:hypothetical protein